MIGSLINLFITFSENFLILLNTWFTTQNTQELSTIDNMRFCEMFFYGKRFGLFYDNSNFVFRILGPNLNKTYSFLEYQFIPEVGATEEIHLKCITSSNNINKEDLPEYLVKMAKGQCLLKYDINFDACVNNHIILYPRKKIFLEFNNLPGVHTNQFENIYNVSLFFHLDSDLMLQYNPLVKHFKVNLTFSSLYSFDTGFRCGMPTDFTITEYREFNFLDKQFPFVREYLGKYSVVAAAGTILAAGVTTVFIGCLGYYIFLI
jgi:hypothetical protein